MTWETVVTFLAGVVAVVVGQLLGGWIERGADERRWQRQDVDRRRARAEEAAEQIMDLRLLHSRRVPRGSEG